MNMKFIGVTVVLFGVLPNADAATTDYLGTDGIQVKPSVSIGGEYRTNLYLDEGVIGGGPEEVSGSSILVNPILLLESNGSSSNMKMGLGYGARTFVDEDLTNLNSFNDGRFTFDANLLPKSKVSLSLSETFVSNNRPVNHQNAENALLRVYDNTTRAALSFGPSNVLKLSLGGYYGFKQINGVKDVAGQRDLINQKNVYGGTWNLSWSFLPKTKLFIDGAYLTNDWSNEAISTNISDVVINDSGSWSTVVGLNGQITSKTLIRFTAGYGSAKYGEDGGGDDNSNDASVDSISDGLHGSAGLSFYPTSNQRLILTYQRAFEDVYFTNYSVYSQVEAGYSVDVLDRLNLYTNANVRQDNYDGPVDRSDVRIGAGAGATVRIQKYVGLTANSNWRRLVSQDGLSEIEYDDISVNLALKFGYW
jgi:hypothetical protein